MLRHGNGGTRNFRQKLNWNSQKFNNKKKKTPTVNLKTKNCVKWILKLCKNYPENGSGGSCVDVGAGWRRWETDDFNATSRERGEPTTCAIDANGTGPYSRRRWEFVGVGWRPFASRPFYRSISPPFPSFFSQTDACSDKTNCVATLRRIFKRGGNPPTHPLPPSLRSLVILLWISRWICSSCSVRA